MTYASVTFHVLSGTGNSLRAARWMADAATARAIPARVRRIEERPQEDPAPGEGHLLGLLLPAHGFTAPWAMIRHVLHLPAGRGTDALVAVTRGRVKLGPVFFPGMEGTAGYLLALLLWLRGYRVRGVTGIDMPSNWMLLHPAQKPETVAAILALARPAADRFIARILEGRRWFRGAICLLLGLALAPVSAGYLLAGRFLLAKLFFANRRCNGCGLCARSCPVGAVRMWRRRPYWTFSCESCMRCMGYCPTAAVEAGQSWGVLLWLAASASFSSWLLRTVAPPEPLLAVIGSAPVRTLLDYGYMLATFAVGYLCFWLLLRVPAINALFTWTTLTHLYRRYREPQTAHRDLGPPRPSDSGRRDG